MNRRCSGCQLIRVQKPVTHTKVYEKGPDDSTSGSSSRRQAPVESESLSEICDSVVPDAKSGVLSEDCGSVKESRGTQCQLELGIVQKRARLSANIFSGEDREAFELVTTESA